MFKRTLWLLVMGRRRREISVRQGYEAYRQRADIEHFFRFGKNHLLMNRYQTVEVEHEENWWELACLAYVLLWLASPSAEILLRPWERYLPTGKNQSIPSPSQVQRAYGEIIRQVGTPACPPKRRGKSPGRTEGWSPGVRARQPVVFKNRSPVQKAA